MKSSVAYSHICVLFGFRETCHKEQYFFIPHNLLFFSSFFLLYMSQEWFVQGEGDYHISYPAADLSIMRIHLKSSTVSLGT